MTDSMMNPAAVRGALSSMMLLYGMNVLWTEDANDTVELKRGVLGSSHLAQLCRYLANAWESGVLRDYLDKGAELRGVLATVEASKLKPRQKNIDVRIVDRAKAIKVLKQLRKRR